MNFIDQPKYPGPRWKILYGNDRGVSRFALIELQRALQNYLPYVITVEPARSAKPGGHTVLLGMISDNPWLKELAAKDMLAVPPKKQGYAVIGRQSPWASGSKIFAIAGNDQLGVLYGVEDFIARILTQEVGPNDPYRLAQALEELDEFSFSDYPLIENRGIWTWGGKIYDYRRFIDNMARLKMNRLTIWNDCPPLNCREVIDYAHERGIKVVLGFHWGWGRDIDPLNARDLQRTKQAVVAEYKKHYQHLGMDGIYFQTFTEQTNSIIRGKTIAALACKWVNDISTALLKQEPQLRIEFGLHATSILDNYGDLGRLRPEVTIVWEDAGVLPYAYDPNLDYRHTYGNKPAGLDSLEATIAYSRKLAAFFGREFAMVAKGFIHQPWETEFEHHGPFVLGERGDEFIRKRLGRRQERWNKVNTGWLKHYPSAARFYREILECKIPGMTVLALVEDGMFEEVIQISVAIFAQTVWNPYRKDDKILRLAMSPYYSGTIRL